MELTIIQFDQLRAKQREDEAAQWWTGKSSASSLTPDISRIARLAIAEVKAQYVRNIKLRNRVRA